MKKSEELVKKNKKNSDENYKECIVCNSKFDNFIPGGLNVELFSKHHIIGGGYRENCYCPNCGVSDRERWLNFVIKNKTNIHELEGRILHFAPEYSIIEYIKKNGKIDYYSCDILSERAMHIVDITNIQFKNKTFDYAICNHVMEHIPNEKKAVKEIKRILKKNGKWIFSFPICLDMKTQENKKVKSPEERIRLYGQEDHVRLYGTDFVKKYEKYGLKLSIYSPKNELTEEEISRYGLIKDDIIIIATKK